MALFGESERQKNPHAITAGITYTPFPLLTAGVDYRRGKNGADDTRLNLGLTYRIGEPLAHQLDSGYVGVKRSLAANRLELVNRNNDVVLEYRKQTLITLQLPPDVYGAELTTVTLTPQVNAKYGLSRIELDDAELRQAGGKLSVITGSKLLSSYPHGHLTVRASHSPAGHGIPVAISLILPVPVFWCPRQYSSSWPSVRIKPRQPQTVQTVCATP